MPLERPQKGARKLDIDGQIWWWTIGHLLITIWGPDGTKHRVTITEVRGVSPAVYERGQHKRTVDGMVTPAHVRQWIQRQ